MNHVTSRHLACGSRYRVAQADRRLLIGLPLHIGPAGAGDRRGHTAAMLELRVGGVGDRIDIELGHVRLQHFQLDHRHNF